MLYADRCGTCHRPHHPGGLTPKMWETMIRRMEGEMDRRGMRGLSPEERTTILEYLTRHAYAE